MNPSTQPARRPDLRLLAGIPFAAGAALALGLVVTPSTAATTTSSTPTPTPSCTASLRTIATWDGGYSTEVQVTAGSTPITRWETDLPGHLVVHYLWGGTLNDRTVSSWNDPMPAGSSTYFGFTGGGSLPTPPPLACRAYR